MFFSKISNALFYGLNDDKDKSILKEVNDSKVILILYNLHLLTNKKGVATITINYLIEECNYKIAKNTQIQFKNILTKLQELKLIHINNKFKTYNDIIIIDTSNLNIKTNYFIVEDDELKTIKDNTKDTREYLNLVKIYYYLKARINKGNNIAIEGGKSQTTFNTYEDISKYTLISEANIKKYIDKLQELKLIKYTNLGYKYKADNIKLKTECANIYALTNISKEIVDIDLKEGLKQQQYYYEKEGYLITEKGYKANNRQLAGEYGSLIRKEKENKITDIEKERLNEIKLTYDLLKE